MARAQLPELHLASPGQETKAKGKKTFLQNLRPAPTQPLLPPEPPTCPPPSLCFLQELCTKQAMAGPSWEPQTASSPVPRDDRGLPAIPPELGEQGTSPELVDAGARHNQHIFPRVLLTKQILNLRGEVAVNYKTLRKQILFQGTAEPTQEQW